jgi:alpha-tubulin suppressor-like RCC1 family protein
VDSAKADALVDASRDSVAAPDAPSTCPADAGDAAAGEVTAIVSGGFFSCALTATGAVYCWGDNQAGNLGDGTMASSSTPVRVGCFAGATAIAVNRAQACALLGDGSVSCWGLLWSSCSAGNCTATNTTSPTTVAGLTGATSISVGYDASCALLASGTVSCWGSNESGELGADAGGFSTTPVTIQGLTGVTALAVGDISACALVSDGSVHCWGNNQYGALGNGTTTNSSTPVTVSGVAGATAIATSADHACALLSGGSVACWGFNLDGQLGNGTVSSVGSTPCECIPTPVPVSGLEGAVAISAGFNDSCALASDGTAYCWGDNEYGQFGDGTTTSSPTPVAVSGLSARPTAVTTGWDNACALLPGGSVECWGYNLNGALGDGTTNNSSTPVPVVW